MFIGLIPVTGAGGAHIHCSLIRCTCGYSDLETCLLMSEQCKLPITNKREHTIKKGLFKLKVLPYFKVIMITYVLVVLSNQNSNTVVYIDKYSLVRLKQRIWFPGKFRTQTLLSVSLEEVCF